MSSAESNKGFYSFAYLHRLYQKITKEALTGAVQAMEYLSSPHISIPGEEQEAASLQRSAPTPSIVKSNLRQKLLPLRLLTLSLASMIAGALLGLWLLPLLPVTVTESILLAHFPQQDGSPAVSLPLQFVRLCLSCAPMILILWAAGLTSFCNGVISVTLALGGLGEGCSLYLLTSVALGRIAVPDQGSANGMTRLWVLYGLWVLILLCIRLILSLSSMHTADKFFDPRVRLKSGEKGLSPLLTRHVLLGLVGMGVLMLACGGYLLVINTWYIL